MKSKRFHIRRYIFKKERDKEMKKEQVLRKAKQFLNRNWMTIICLSIMVIMMTNSVFAAKTADQLWTDVSNLMKTWVTRLGAVVMFVGGVMFGLGWKSDDAEQKSRGVSTIVAGGIVCAVAQAAANFF